MSVSTGLKERIELGRRAVDTYRAAHAQLHGRSWYPQIHDDHTPLLEKAIEALKVAGFDSLDAFFAASELQNIMELGFADLADFEASATQADREAFETKWH